MRILAQFRIRQSFSRVGMPANYGWAKSFFATLKKESPQYFATRDEACQAISAYIESFYNTVRVQARLGYLSPGVYAELPIEQFRKTVA